MKTLFLVFGKNSHKDELLAHKILPTTPGYNIYVLHCLNDDDQATTLQRIITALQEHGEDDYKNILVAYSGSHLSFLEKYIRCEICRVSKLIEKLNKLTNNPDSGEDPSSLEPQKGWVVIPFHIIWKTK